MLLFNVALRHEGSCAIGGPANAREERARRRDALGGGCALLRVKSVRRARWGVAVSIGASRDLEGDWPSGGTRGRRDEM